MPRVLMISNGAIDIFSSRENLCSYIEYPSFDGNEKAILENGSSLELFLDEGVEVKNILGKKYVKDFKYVNFIISDNPNISREVMNFAVNFLNEKHIFLKKDYNISDVFDELEKITGITF